MKRPIKATAHGAIDYGFLAAQLAGPSLLGLRGPARTLPAVFGVTQGTINALTDTPVGVKPVMSLRTHGWLEAASGPLFAFLPWYTGALKDPKAKGFFGGLLAALAVVYTLTDWHAPAAS